MPDAPALRPDPRFGVLFCCMGNICRSPSAEGVFRAMAAEAGITDRLRIDSAGTHDYHVGAPPDRRAQSHALRRGYDLSGLRARQVGAADFDAFDLVLAMDRENLALLRRVCPPRHASRLRLMMSFAPAAGTDVVPDPYYGDGDGFERVLDLLELASRGLLAHVLEALRQPG